MSGEKSKQEGSINLGEILAEIFGQVIGVEGIDVTVGDKVNILNKNHVTYLVPKGSKTTLGGGLKHSNIGLSTYFTEVPGEVIKINKNFVYNCGHCAREHVHDILVYYKELNKSFYTSSDGIKVVS